MFHISLKLYQILLQNAEASTNYAYSTSYCTTGFDSSETHAAVSSANVFGS